MQVSPVRRSRPATPKQKSAPPAAKSRMPGEDRRRQILDVAVEVFARNGFGGTKTKEIALAAGISEAILFRHFASKEDLYHAILDSRDNGGAERLLRTLEVFAERRDDYGLFHCIATHVFGSFQQDPAFHRLMLYARLEGHLLAGLFHKRFGVPVIGFLDRYIALRQKEGAFHRCDPQVAGMFAVGVMVHIAMAKSVFQLRRAALPDEAMAREVVDLVLNGLAESGGLRQKKSTASKSKNQKEKLDLNDRQHKTVVD
jgi:AcrR family transcriptional regulator